MAGKFKSWPYPKQCPDCSGAWYDESNGDTPCVCQLLGKDGTNKAFGNNAPVVCGDFRKGKMRIAEGINASLGFKSKAKSDGGKIFEGAGQILRSASNDRSLSGDELIGGGLKIAGGLGKLAVKGVAKGIKYAAEKEKRAEEEEARRTIENSWEIINNVTFSNTKETINEIENLFDVFSTIYASSDDTIGFENKEAIADACLVKLEEGIGLLRGAPDKDAKKVDEFQIELQKSKLDRLNIKNYDEPEDAKAAFYNKNITIINSVSFDGGIKLVMKSLDSLLSIKNSLFSFMSLFPIKSSFFSSVTMFPIKSRIFSFLSGGNGITSYQKRALCDLAIEKIEQGINLYKNDPNHDSIKLAKYEARLEDFRINRNGITFSIDQKFDAETGKNIISNISLDGSSAFIEAGIEAILSVKNALFNIFGSGKKISSADKKEISNSAIEKMECGITALKKNPVYNVKKLAKYEKELASFRESAQRL
ncbi:hypothetical protein [Treponema sp. R80B11-R83G3]